MIRARYDNTPVLPSVPLPPQFAQPAVVNGVIDYNGWLKPIRRFHGEVEAEGHYLGCKKNRVEKAKAAKAEAYGSEGYLIAPCGCGRQVCPRCGRKLAWVAQDRMIRGVKMLQLKYGCKGDVQLWTLTVNRDLYESPEAAYRDVGKKRRIGELMRAMGVRYYVVAVEWHSDPDGWPHWHVLIWEPVKACYHDKHKVQAQWGIGNVWYSGRYRNEDGSKRRKPRTINGVVRYMVKYLVKEDGVMPEWVGDAKRMQRIWACKHWTNAALPLRRRIKEGVDLDTGEVSECAESAGGEAAADAAARADARPNRQAVAECARRCVLLHVDKLGGHHYVGQVDLPWRSVRKLSRRIPGAEVYGSFVRFSSREDLEHWLPVQSQAGLARRAAYTATACAVSRPTLGEGRAEDRQMNRLPIAGPWGAGREMNRPTPIEPNLFLTNGVGRW